MFSKGTISDVVCIAQGGECIYMRLIQLGERKISQLNTQILNLPVSIRQKVIGLIVHYCDLGLTRNLCYYAADRDTEVNEHLPARFDRIQIGRHYSHRLTCGITTHNQGLTMTHFIHFGKRKILTHLIWGYCCETSNNRHTIQGITTVMGFKQRESWTGSRQLQDYIINHLFRKLLENVNDVTIIMFSE